MRRQSWEEVKKHKRQLAQLEMDYSYQNAELMKKAEKIAEKMLEHEFVLNVGLLGSTARGEAGRDIDLIIIDDGTISDNAISVSKLAHNLKPRSSSAGNYSFICHDLFIDHIHGGTEGDFFEYLYEESPYAVDLIFVNDQVHYDQEYLDQLIFYGMPDTYFFRNIGEDILLFNPEKKKFVKDENYAWFVNNGVPSDGILSVIKLREYLPR